MINISILTNTFFFTSYRIVILTIIIIFLLGLDPIIVIFPVVVSPGTILPVVIPGNIGLGWTIWMILVWISSMIVHPIGGHMNGAPTLLITTVAGNIPERIVLVTTVARN